MILITNGCSMSYGVELAEETFEEKRYSALLAKKLDWDEENISEGGSSNDRIVRTTIDWLMKTEIPKEEIFFLIQMSNIARTEYYYEKHDCFYQVLPNMESDKNEEGRITYYKHLQHDYHDIIKFYNQLYILKNIFENHNIKYLIFEGYENRNEYKDYKIIEHLKINDIRVCPKDVIMFNKLKDEYKVKFGPRIHPLEEGHFVWANVLYTYISKNKLV